MDGLPVPFWSQPKIFQLGADLLRDGYEAIGAAASPTLHGKKGASNRPGPVTAAEGVAVECMYERQAGSKSCQPSRHAGYGSVGMDEVGPVCRDPAEDRARSGIERARRKAGPQLGNPLDLSALLFEGEDSVGFPGTSAAGQEEAVDADVTERSIEGTEMPNRSA